MNTKHFQNRISYIIADGDLIQFKETAGYHRIIFKNNKQQQLEINLYKPDLEYFAAKLRKYKAKVKQSAKRRMQSYNPERKTL